MNGQCESDIGRMSKRMEESMESADLAAAMILGLAESFAPGTLEAIMPKKRDPLRENLELQSKAREKRERKNAKRLIEKREAKS